MAAYLKRLWGWKQKNIVVRKRGCLSKYYNKILVSSQQHEVIQVDPDIPNSLTNDSDEKKSNESGTWIDVMTMFKDSTSHEPLEDNLCLLPSIISSFSNDNINASINQWSVFLPIYVDLLIPSIRLVHVARF